MTNVPPASPPSAAEIPSGIRAASTVCWIVGIITILVALALGIPAIATGDGLLFIAVNGLAGLVVCLAAVQIRRQRKIGVLLMVVAWAIPTIVALVQHLPVRGSLLLFLALVLTGANWKHFR
ncbi:MAG TPA: hypothetical protein VKD28_13970 [Gemmatimonadales bacterium]|nr:hypothetical protein [Gemmatimonadales bacterium]